VKGLLLAGGHGTRLRPLTSTGNKHMLPIANKPMLLYGLEHLRDAGIYEIGVVLGPVREGVKEMLGDGSSFGVEITYIEQTEPKGIAHAVMVAQEYLGEEPFVLYLGDNLIKQGVTPMVKEFANGEYDCVVSAAKVSNPSQYGVIVFGEEGKPIRFVEKPKKPVSEWAMIGIYVFNRKIFDALNRISPSLRGEYEITDTIQILLDEGAKVHVNRVQGWWKDTGAVTDLLDANRLVLDDIQRDIQGQVEDESSVVGRVSIGRGSIVNKGAKVMGPAIIGQETILDDGVYIGPYTSIGNKVVLKKGEVENSIIMDNCQISIDERIVNSLIGSNSIISTKKNGGPKGKRFIVGERSTIEL
jgi:glucose-1-phosphate thymidylyltransferase